MKLIQPINNKKYLLVFVHGLVGGEETWLRKDGNKSILEYLSHDSQIRQYFDIALFQYDSTLTNIILKIKYLLNVVIGRRTRFTRNLPIRKLADLFLNELEIEAIDYDKIIIIAHSMGGLISKKLILDEIAKAKLTDTSPKIGLYITLATPHAGSELASLGKLLLSSKQIKNLAPTNDELIDMNRSWVQARQLPKTIYFQGYNDQIVPEGAGGIDASISFPISSKDDHFSILVPTPETKHVLNAIKDACIEFVNENGIKTEKSRHIDVLPPHITKSNISWKIISILGIVTTVILMSYVLLNKKPPTQQKSVNSNSYLDSLIRFALDSTDRPYIIPNALMDIEVNRVDDSIEAEITLIYSIIYIRSQSPSGAFNESYDKLNDRIRPLSTLTSNENINMTSDHSWWLRFSTSIGQPYLPMSKFKLRWHITTPPTKKNFWNSRNPNEVIFEYPNQDGDILPNLTLMISSTTLNLDHAEAKHGFLTADKINNAEAVRPYNPEQTQRPAFLATFHNLRKGEHAQLKVSWQ